MADDPKDVKPAAEHVSLRVTNQDGSSVTFKIKKHASLKKLMNAYCSRAGLAIDTVRFRFDGVPLNPEDTAADLNMEDEDNIDVFQNQTGGGD
ncbi:small ubiquitin-related modifier 3-like [Watersipora subatra]|uniref:small ubiquitin-related modifier 3-like n=1 Tax=Watersipora subatra TaxID=2589382 RepID=UPI00355BE106